MAGKKIALFIDADNISPRFGKKILETLESRGELFIRRIYGNWEKSSLHGWNETILSCSLRAVQQPDFVTGKNATDMSLTIDAMDVLHDGKAEIFALVSNDSDFTPLVIRLREGNVAIIGLGNAAHASAAFRSACTEFIDLDSLDRPIKTVPTAPTVTPVPQISTPLPKIKLIPIEKVKPVKKIASDKKISSVQMSLFDGENSAKPEPEPKSASPKVVPQPKPQPEPQTVSPKVVPITKSETFVKQDRFQIIHDFLMETARLYGDKNGFANINRAKQNLCGKNFNFSIRNLGYGSLREFISAFHDRYIFRKNNGNLLYCCFKDKEYQKFFDARVDQLHEILQAAGKSRIDKNGFIELRYAKNLITRRKLGFTVEDLGYKDLQKFINAFPARYIVRNVLTKFSYRCLFSYDKKVYDEKLEQLHQFLYTTAQTLGESDGFVELSRAGDTMLKSLGFGVKSFSYKNLQRLIADFPDRYEMITQDGNKVYYRCSVDATETPTDDIAVNAVETPTDDTAVNAVETPTDDIAVNATETPTDNIAVNATEAPTDDIAVNATEAPTDDIVINATETPTDDIAVNAAQTPTDDIAVNAVETPTDDIAVNATATPTDDIAVNATETPTDDIAVNATQTPTDDIAVNATKTPTDDIAVNAVETPTDDIAVNATETPTDDIAVNATEAPTDDIAVNAVETPTDDIAVNATEAPTDDIVVNATKTPTDDIAVNATETPTDDIAVNATQAPTDDIAVNATETPTDDIVVDAKPAPVDERLQKLHDILHIATYRHGVKGWLPINYAGEIIRHMRLGFGVKDFGYKKLRQFMGDYPEIYKVEKRNSDRLYYYCCLTNKFNDATKIDALEQLHNIFYEVSIICGNEDHFVNVVSVSRFIKKHKTFDEEIQKLTCNDLLEFLLTFPNQYEICKKKRSTLYRCNDEEPEIFSDEEIAQLHDVLNDVAKLYAQDDGLVNLWDVCLFTTDKKNLSDEIQNLSYQRLRNFVEQFPDRYKVFRMDISEVYYRPLSTAKKVSKQKIKATA